MINRFESIRYPIAYLSHSFWFRSLKLCANQGLLREAKMMHSNVIKLGDFQALSMHNQVLYAYVKCGLIRDAHQLFDEMPARNIVSWNTMISAVVENVELGFCYFKRMLREVVLPDSMTMNALIRSCARFGDVGLGRKVHCFAVKFGLSLDRSFGSAIMDLYGRFGFVCDAKSAFDDVEFKDLVLWNVMVSMYVNNCLIHESFDIFRSMRDEGVKGDEFTFSTLLSSCSSTQCGLLGKQLHGLVLKLFFDSDLLVASVLIDMYAKNGSICDARRVFDEMGSPNLATWNTMIVGYEQNGHGRKSMELCREMVRKNIDLGELTVSSIVSSCGNLAAISETAQINAYSLKSGFDSCLSVVNALINAYSNGGSLSSASKCFDSAINPDLITWTSILNAHAFHGHVERSITIFDSMLMSGQRPDHVVFLGILSACSRGGLVNEGLRYFNLMTTEYNIRPSSEHSACIINLLGKSGLVNEASKIIDSGLVGIDSNALKTLIDASKSHGHIELAEWGSRKLYELEPNNSANYTLMSNVYAFAGQWKDVAKVRKMMKEKMMHSKVPGCSWIEVAGKVHTFVARDSSHSSVNEVYSMMGILTKVMKDDDFVDVLY